MKKSAIYIRVSTTHQIDKDSLPMQRNDMINYSRYVLNIEDYEVFEDAGFSGKNTMRPAFQNMMKRIKEGEFSHLLVWKIDRVSRNLIDFCEMYENLKKYNCVFISKNEQFDTSSAMGETMLKIVLVFAELERKLAAERVSATMIDRATKGMWNGAPIPLGYKWDKDLKFPVIDPIEKITVELIYNQYREFESTSIVRNLLNENNIKTKKGASWSTKTISDIIRNPFYKGTYRYNFREAARGKKKNESEWVLVDDNHPGIISKELWEECNNIMDENAKKNNARFRNDARTHIFASLIECMECNNNMYAKEDKAHIDGYRPSIYACKGRYNKLGCTQKTVSDKIVGTFIFNFLSNLIKATTTNNLSEKKLEEILLSGKSFEKILSISNIAELLEIIRTSDTVAFKLKRKKVESRRINEKQNLENELKKYSIALDKLEELYLFGENSMSVKDYILKKDKINKNILEIENKIETLPKELNNYDINFILDVLTLEISKELQKGNIDFKKLILKTDKAFLKEFINSIIKKIYIMDRLVRKIEFKNGLAIEFNY